MAITFLLGTHGGGANAYHSTTSGIDTTGADFFGVGICRQTGFGAAPVMSDSNGNSWAGLTEAESHSTLSRIFYSVPTTVGSGNTFDLFDDSLPSYPALVVGAFSGVDQSSPFDQENGNTADAVEAIQSGSVTPSTDGQLIIAALTIQSVSPTGISIDGGFTIIDTAPQSGNNSIDVLAYLIQTTAAPVNPQWTWTGAGDARATIATFKAASAGTPPTASYHGSPVTLTEGVGHADISPTLDSGDAWDSAAITTGSKPAWLDFDTTTGVFHLNAVPPAGSAGTVSLGVTFTNTSGDGPETTLDLVIGPQLLDTTSGANDSSGCTSDPMDSTGVRALVVVVSSYAPNAAPTFSDSESNSWTERVNRVDGNTRLQVYECIDPVTDAAHTFTASGTSSYASIAGVGFSGVAAFVSKTDNGNAGSITALKPGSITPSNAVNVVVSAFASEFQNGTRSIDSGFTIDQDVDWVSGMNVGVAVAHKIDASGAQDPEWTWPDGTDATAANLVYQVTAPSGSIDFRATNRAMNRAMNRSK